MKLFDGFFRARRPRDPQAVLDALLAEVRRVLDGEVSMLVFGSSASGEFHDHRSDLNVLIVAENFSLQALKQISPALTAWQKYERTVPVLIEREDLTVYATLLPIEFLDMQQHHRMILGSDPLTGLVVSTENLRIQCLQELSVKLLKLRQNVALAANNPKALRGLLIQSISSVLSLFRAALRLEEDVPALKKIDAAKRLAQKLGSDPTDPERIHDLRLRRETDGLENLAERYIEIVEKALRHVSQNTHGR